ncbi:hydrogenase subunit MbhD domain-containing protein [Thermotoga sp. KOL6]|uniref:Na(+)/H(+) antiporter subunit B n=1 Tax=Thermotoga sp. KOL6 TaxID=126741 RepID=UPI000C787050|nr:hydrogenase subunit MbhD domain-containing protein [Thermotoga sp. KOL6]PLV59932.1 sodium:proton antiporter [Thermotoga sp. KOL6]
MNLLLWLTGGMMLAAAIFAVEAKSMLDSVISISALSLLSVFFFLVMKAPDVAITEASVGAGLVTAVLLIALFKMRKGDER